MSGYDTKEALFRDVAEAKRAAEDNGGTIANLGAAVESIQNSLKELHISQRASALAAAQPSGTASEIEDAYTARASEAEFVSGNHRVSRGAGLSYRGKTHVGGDAGVIRMLGSVVDDLGTWEPGLLDDPAPKTEWQKTLQMYVDDASLYRAMTGRRGVKLEKRITRHLAAGPGVISKLFADNATEGAEFIPDVVMPRMLEEMRLTPSLASNFARTTTVTGGTTKNPFLVTGCQPFIRNTPTPGAAQADLLTASQPVTAERTFSPITLAVNLPVDRDAEEDSIIEFGPMGRRLIVDAIRDGREDALINGDTGTHGDTGIATWAGPNGRWSNLGQSNDHRYAWIGFRHRGLDIAGASGDESANQSVTGTMVWKANLNVPQAMGSLLYVMPLQYVIAKILTDSNVLTIDKYGTFATLLTGEIARLGGVPVVISEYMTADLNASGIYDGLTTTQTGGLLINRDRFEIVERRGARIEVEQRPTRHSDYMVASVREVLRTHDSATTRNLYYGYNLDKS
jgi:hypothetical protein